MDYMLCASLKRHKVTQVDVMSLVCSSKNTSVKCYGLLRTQMGEYGFGCYSYLGDW